MVSLVKTNEKELGELPSSSQFWSTANSGDSLGDRVSGLGVVGQIQAHLIQLSLTDLANHNLPIRIDYDVHCVWWYGNSGL